MPALDFKEIAPAQAGGDRDQFELLARELLTAEGFRVVSGPDRGVDFGRDLIVEEDRSGSVGTTTILWLVSCKHKAHSGAAVNNHDEDRLRDRLEMHNCDGFMPFYSVVPSSGLAAQIDALKPKFELIIYDQELIERKLLENPRGRAIAARFFPRSYPRWIQASQYADFTPRPVKQRAARDNFFLRQPHALFESAQREAKARDIPLFIVIYDPNHSTLSKLDHSLGYFMEYEITKRLVDQHFVVAVAASSEVAP